MSATVIPMQHPTAVESAFKYPSEWRFCIIRSGSKKPTLERWNEGANAFVPAQLDPGTAGIGLLHRWSATCSLDIDAMVEARAWLAERDVDLDALLNADDACQILSREGKGKLLYKMPAGRTMETKRIVKDMATFLEFRNSDKGGNSVQCCLPPTIHPVTCQPYTWGGKGHYSALPALPEALLKVWEELIEADKVPRVSIRGEYAASAEEVASAVAFCDPDSDRTPWLHVGMALKLELGDAGCQIWDEWSRKSIKYPGEREMVRQWRSFKNDKPIVVTVGTIFHHARANGWKRPAPDLLRLFNAGNIKMPEALLSDLFPPVPPINLELLPPVLAHYAAEVAQSVGCDPIVPALAGMGAICAAIDARSRIRIKKDWDEPPILWLLTHGMPADKKTPGSKPMLRVLADIEKADSARYKMDMLRWEAEEAAFAAAKKDLLAKAGSAEHALNTGTGCDPLQALPQMPTLRPQPMPLMLVLHDTTSQAAAKEAIARPEGLLLHKDEMADWLQRVADPRSGENKSFYVESYEGNRYRHSRVGKGSGEGNYETDNLAISVYGNVQPDVLRDAAPTITKDGMRARFIVGVLNTELTTVSSEYDLPDFLSGKHNYEQMIRNARAQAATEYTLSPEAYRTFRQWEADVIEHGKTLKRQGHSSFLQGLVGKGQGLAGRTALVFHVAENPGECVVSNDTMQRAVAFLREFVIPHAVHVDRQCEVASLERWIIHRIIKLSNTERISLSELERAAQRVTSLKAEKRVMEDRIRSIMGMLAEAGWVVLIRDDSKSTSWDINPKLDNLFMSERTEMLLDDANFRQEIVRSRDQ